MADLAEIVRGEAARYLASNPFTSGRQRKALRDIALCRTEAMGTVSVPCERCPVEYRLFRSCRNRSCPLCQGEARASWLVARKAEILPVKYLQVGFNAPAAINELSPYCPKVFYDAVIQAAGQAVIDIGRSVLHAQLGCQVQLHTWSRTMARHIHAHCVVPCGGFSEDESRWISFEPSQLPVGALDRRFRTLLCQKLRLAARKGKLELPAAVSVEQLLEKVRNGKPTVYAKPPFGGPEKLLEYLAQSMYRVAISNHRIESYENGQVRFGSFDYPGGNKVTKKHTFAGQEFVRRFVTHVPPKGFVRMRSYGFMGNRDRKQNIERARQLLGQVERPPVAEPFRPVRLCPACSERAGRKSHFASAPTATPQFNLFVRPPPTQSAA